MLAGLPKCADFGRRDPLTEVLQPLKSSVGHVPSARCEDGVPKELIEAESDARSNLQRLFILERGAGVPRPPNGPGRSARRRGRTSALGRRLGPHSDSISLESPRELSDLVRPQRRQPKFCLSPRRRPAAVRRANASGAPRPSSRGRGDPHTQHTPTESTATPYNTH